MKKKLLFKLWQFPHLSETFILAQIITAIKCGYDVKILVDELLDFDESRQYEEIKKYQIENKIIFEDYHMPAKKWTRIFKSIILVLQNLRYIHYLFKFIYYNKRRSLKNIYEFQFYKRFRNLDIIHVQYGTNVKPVDLLKSINFLKPRLIVSFHGHDAFFPINGIIPNNGYYDHLFRCVDIITANTPYLGNCIRDLGFQDKRLKIIPVGVNTEKFHSEFEPGKKDSRNFKLISVGRLDKVKGHKYAIQVTKNLLDKNYEVELSIIGEGKERENLERLISLEKLEGSVFLLGKKSQLEVRELLSNHDAYIFAAVPLGNGRRETQGLATLEAQACGLPVVAFDSGGVKYTIDDGITGFIVPEYDIEKMTNRIAQLINDRDQLNKMGREAVKYVEVNFSQSRIDEVWCETYNSVLK